MQTRNSLKMIPMNKHPNKRLNKRVALATLIITAVLSAGCAETRRTLIKEKGAPDEFQVYTRAPLSLPPDYGLRPPAQPGTGIRPQDDPREKARAAVLGTAAKQAPVSASSPGLAVIYARTGVGKSDPNIRQLVNRESSAYAEEDQSVMEGLMFGDDPEYGVSVDPERELKRIRENQALGHPINEGEVPTIERSSTNLLKGLFD